MEPAKDRVQLASEKSTSARRTFGPDVVVFEHNHTAKVVPVGVDAAHQHAVFLHESETCPAERREREHHN